VSTGNLNGKKTPRLVSVGGLVGVGYRGSWKKKKLRRDRRGLG